MSTFRLLVYIVSLAGIVRSADWWQRANFYQIYPRSFQDSDGDGIGDLRGIAQRLEYFSYLGINGVWLSPIFPSPMKDFGYDISDYRGIHHEFGTMADFRQLLQRCHELNIKLVLDFVPNHSSDQHAWFVASSDPEHPDYGQYKDYYVWHDGKRDRNGTVIGPPSNWLSMFRNSAWTLHKKRNQYYLHQFLASQPDLNFRCAAVRAEMESILRFWFDMGVDGVRIDAVPHVFEAKVNPRTHRYDDEPPSGYCKPDEHCYLRHIYTAGQPETLQLVYQWRKLTDSYTTSTRILMTEAYGPRNEIMPYYGGKIGGEPVDGAHVPFNFDFLGRPYDAYACQDNIWGWLNEMPKGANKHANWVLGNHDQKRVSTRYGPRVIDLANILTNTLPGIAITYYGEEIGMVDQYISWEDTVDPQACRTNPDMFHWVSRDPARTPMQWDASPNAGFSTAPKTWLPLADNYTACNVELQKTAESSHLKVFKALLELREHPVMQHGHISTNVVGKDVLVYERATPDNETADIIYVILNFGEHKASVQLPKLLNLVPELLEVRITSIHSESLVVGQNVSSESIDIDGGVGAVLVGRKRPETLRAYIFMCLASIVALFLMCILYVMILACRRRRSDAN